MVDQPERYYRVDIQFRSGASESNLGSSHGDDGCGGNDSYGGINVWF
jgi:hypothetical protein